MRKSLAVGVGGVKQGVQGVQFSAAETSDVHDKLVQKMAWATRWLLCWLDWSCIAEMQ